MGIANLVLLSVAFSAFMLMGCTQAPNPPVACAADAMVCPDGSSVGRVPPACNFAPCPQATASATPSNDDLPPLPPTDDSAPNEMPPLPGNDATPSVPDGANNNDLPPLPE